MRSPLLASLVISAAVAGAAILACGGNSPEPAAPSTTADAGGAAPTADPGSSGGATATATTADAGGGAAAPDTKAAAAEPDFDALPKDKKVDIMMSKVVPNVGKLFKEHDGKKFAKFTCATCHGQTKDKSKEDPHKVLPKLTFSNGGYAKLEKAKPEMVKFMNEKVLPAMIEALGEKPADPKTKKGFGCGGCHSVD
jgi:hypothetical protein